MTKIQKPSELCNTFSFTEFDYVKNHELSFCNTELGKLKKLFPFESVIKHLSPVPSRHSKKGRKELFDAEAKIGLMILKARYNFSDRILIEQLNSNIHFQLFCGVIISPTSPIVDYKIVSRIRTELGHKLNINEFQKSIAEALKPHITSNDLKVVMSDATCYESSVRYPTNQKVLWESIDWLYKMIKKDCKMLSIPQPRTRYIHVAEAYRSYSKSRKKSYAYSVRITRRLLHLLEKLIAEAEKIFKATKIELTYDYNKRYDVIKIILGQQTKLFAGEEVTERIVSIDKPYLRPIVRGKEIKRVEFGAKVNSIQVGGFNFVEYLSFDAFHEGIRLPDCINLHKMLFKVKPRFFAGDAIYATNANRSYCKANHIITNFVPKGRLSSDEKQKKSIRKTLNVSRATVLEGSFGTEKEYYSLKKIKARTKKNEILWILFGIHTANFSRLARRIVSEVSEVDMSA